MTAVCLALEAAHVFREEIRWKTLSSLVTLPVSVPELAYRKVAGTLAGTLPLLAGFVLGMLLVPEDVGEFLTKCSESRSLLECSCVAILQFILFLHLTAFLSLIIKRGALPLAIAIQYLGGSFFTDIFDDDFFDRRRRPRRDLLLYRNDLCGDDRRFALRHRVAPRPRRRRGMTCDVVENCSKTRAFSRLCCWGRQFHDHCLRQKSIGTECVTRSMRSALPLLSLQLRSRRFYWSGNTVFRFMHAHRVARRHHWDDPGGNEESQAEAARRELFEETGYAAAKMELLTTGAASSGLTSGLVLLSEGVLRLNKSPNDETMG